MPSKNTQSSTHPQISEQSERCYLELSSDTKWLRLVVGGRRLAAFHVDYVRKVVAADAKRSKVNSKIESSEVMTEV